METVAQENVVLSQNQPILPEQPKQNNFLTILLSILLLLSVSIAGFFAYQTQMLVKELTSIKATSTPVLTEETVEDPTADWKTYTNTKHNFLVKYPPEWKLENLNDRDEFNANPRLVNGNFIIQIYANMDGLGGSGMDYTGSKSVVVSGLNLYKYESENPYGMTKQIGITDELKNSLGAFKYLNKSYSIFLTYPSTGLPENKVRDLKLDFDQILSTFKFVDSGLTSTNTDSQMIEVAAKTALVKKIGQEPTTKYGLSNESLKVVEDWAFGIITIAPVGEGAGPGANYFLARKINNIWEANIEYTDEFREWLKTSPNGLVSAELKQTLQ